MSKKKNKFGSSLIEIMVSSLVIAVLASGGSAALYHTRSVIGAQEAKREAVDQADTQLELLKRAQYSTMRPKTDDIYYYVDTNQNALMESVEMELTQSVDTQKTFPMITTIKLIVPPPAVSTEGEYLLVSVTVTYDLAGNQVILESIITPTYK